MLDSRLSRLTAWRSYALLWASGLCVQNFSSGIYGLLLFGRIWGGLGAGGLTVVTPIYLSEVTPAHSRGWIVSLYMVFLLSFLSLGEHVISSSRFVVFTDMDRFFRQLCLRQDPGCYQRAVQDCAVGALDTRWNIILLLFFSCGDAAILNYTRSRG